MAVGANGRGHMNDSIDEFRFLHFRHRCVSAQKFARRELVAVFEWRHCFTTVPMPGGAW